MRNWCLAAKIPPLTGKPPYSLIVCVLTTRAFAKGPVSQLRIIAVQIRRHEQLFTKSKNLDKKVFLGGGFSSMTERGPVEGQGCDELDFVVFGWLHSWREDSR